MLLRVIQWIPPSPGVCRFSFPSFCLWLGYGGVWHKSRFSDYWRADWTVSGRELVFVNVYLPLSLSFYIVLLLGGLINIIFFCINYLLYLLTNNRGLLTSIMWLRGLLCKH